MVAQWEWGLCGVPDKGKSHLISRTWGRDKDMPEPLQRFLEWKVGCLLGPPGFINRDVSHQRLGPLDLFQNVSQCFSSSSKKIRIWRKKVVKSIRETDFFFSNLAGFQQWQKNNRNGRSGFSVYSTNCFSIWGYYHYVEGTSSGNTLLIFTKLQVFFLYRERDRKELRSLYLRISFKLYFTIKTSLIPNHESPTPFSWNLNPYRNRNLQMHVFT